MKFIISLLFIIAFSTTLSATSTTLDHYTNRTIISTQMDDADPSAVIRLDDGSIWKTSLETPLDTPADKAIIIQWDWRDGFQLTAPDIEIPVIPVQLPTKIKEVELLSTTRIPPKKTQGNQIRAFHVAWQLKTIAAVTLTDDSKWIVSTSGFPPALGEAIQIVWIDNGDTNFIPAMISADTNARIFTIIGVN